ncbi:phytanoyl-CoA dioxygenase [Parasphingopyxis sp. CP4]|uniref:phytanoyl-CoA dioxygenase n=1 Tax=Parasphingopyxis sp. CP4 TaxID=2724527 RepID=UPI001C40B8B1|nr:phytanoyl-CoA dioxygenase [Parasphingopyxis sp. CP4]
MFDARAAARPGLRIEIGSKLKTLLGVGSEIGSIADRCLGEKARPVRAVIFNKTPGTNWALGWHQDRTIAVAERHDQPGFGPWTVKNGTPHVEPPFTVMESMMTLRVHIDAVDDENAPLVIALGSHKTGRIAVSQIDDVVGRCALHSCHAEPGSIWAYSTPILHRSDLASGDRQRRVLQIDYSTVELPEPLRWAAD